MVLICHYAVAVSTPDLWLTAAQYFSGGTANRGYHAKGTVGDSG